jgi:hypothetical protein
MSNMVPSSATVELDTCIATERAWRADRDCNGMSSGPIGSGIHHRAPMVMPVDEVACCLRLIQLLKRFTNLVLLLRATTEHISCSTPTGTSHKERNTRCMFSRLGIGCARSLMRPPSHPRKLSFGNIQRLTPGPHSVKSSNSCTSCTPLVAS